MKRLVVILSMNLLVLVSLFMVAAPRVLAFNPFPTDQVCTGDNQSSPVCQATTENPVSGPNGVLVKVIKLLLIVVGIASVIAIMLGGLQYIISSGDPNRINKAKDTILYAIIGLAVALLGQVVISFVIRRI